MLASFSAVSGLFGHLSIVAGDVAALMCVRSGYTFKFYFPPLRLDFGICQFGVCFIINFFIRVCLKNYA